MGTDRMELSTEKPKPSPQSAGKLIDQIERLD